MNNEMKRGAPKGDEYVVSLYLRQKRLEISKYILMKAHKSKMRALL